jgi:hypothetical protein
MSDTIITMADGSRWKPSTSSDTVHCVNCDNAVQLTRQKRLQVTPTATAQTADKLGQALKSAVPE